MLTLSLGWNVAMDFLLALFPVTIVYGLQMSTDRKVAISILLGLGMLYVEWTEFLLPILEHQADSYSSGICAAIKTAKLSALASRADPLWAEYDLYTWVA